MRIIKKATLQKFTVNVLATTALSLLVLGGIAAIQGGQRLFISSVFQTFIANFIVHAGFLLTKRLESKYFLIETAIDISYIILVLIVCGARWDWFQNGTPAGTLVSMAVIIYFIGSFLSIFWMREEINTINRLLRKRKEKSDNEKDFIGGKHH